MAGGFVGSDVGKRAELYEGRITGYFMLACLIGSTGGSLFGYDLGVSGGVTSMDDFLEEFFPKIYRRKQNHLNETDYCKYDNQLLTLFTSALYLSGLTSTFAAAYVSRKYGRRISILVGSLNFFLGGGLNAIAQNILMLILGRILLGIGIGFGNQAVPLYLSELSPPKIRGAVSQLFQLTTGLGMLVAGIVNYFTSKLHPWGWRLSLGLAMMPATIMFIGGLFLPETPNSLVEQGKVDEARRVLEKVRGTKNVDAEFEDLKDASRAAQAVKNPFRNLFFNPKHRPQLVIGAIGIPSFQQLTGMNSLHFYAPVIFQSLGMGSNASLYSAILTSSSMVLGGLVSMFLVDRWGRRFFFIQAGFQMVTTMVTVAVILATKFGTGVELPKTLGFIVVLCTCLFTVSFGWSWGPFGWLVPAELFPLETRSSGQSMVVFVNLIFTFGIAQCFLAMLCHLKWGVFLLFAGMIVIMTSFIYLLLPETKQVPIEEIHRLFEKHWYWKKFVCRNIDDKVQQNKTVYEA